MATTITKTIGSGGDYATIALWMADIPADLTVADEVWVGEILPGTLTVSAEMQIGSGVTTDTTRYIHLKNHSAAQNNGRSLAAGGTANAVVDGTGVSGAHVFDVRSKFVRISGIEIIGPGTFTGNAINVSNAAAASGLIQIFRNIVHNDDQNDDASGIRMSLANLGALIHNNIVYGFGANGIVVAGASPTVSINNNTSCYNCLAGGTSDDNIKSQNAAHSCANNAAFEPNAGADYGFVVGGDDGQNASGDTSGTPGFTDFSVASQFMNPTTTWAAMDLRLLSKSQLIGQAATLGTDYDPDCRGAARTVPWDIGAIEYTAALDEDDDDDSPHAHDVHGLRYRRNFQRDLFNRLWPRAHF